ncbi:MAG: GTP 3',8-cyclase MoaA [Deltaproteobacteria bacterium]|nr:GTP 3',8-cyclase MoaA [Deltaproteobacteria bacterium]
MTDSFNRRISYLRLSVTDRCNLRCVYCMPAEGVALMDHAAILSYEEMLRIARVAAGAGITKIRITGGEPLVRKGIADLVAELNHLAGIADISITTNGILLEAAAGALRRAGLRRINISLDTLDPVKYKQITRGGDLAAVLAGIHAARMEGFSPIKVNVVVMRGINDAEITSFAALTMERPVHIRFIEFMPINGHAGLDKSVYISNADIREKIQTIGELLPLPIEPGAGPARLYQLRGAQGKLGFISPLSNHFCATCNRLRLTADGRLRTCLFSDTETDLRLPLRSGCSDADLLGLMARAIFTKPFRHAVLEPSFQKCSRGMSAIGG